MLGAVPPSADFPAVRGRGRTGVQDGFIAKIAPGAGAITAGAAYIYADTGVPQDPQRTAGDSPRGRNSGEREALACRCGSTAFRPTHLDR